MPAIIRPMDVFPGRMSAAGLEQGLRLLLLVLVLQLFVQAAPAQSPVGLTANSAAVVRGTVLNAATGTPVSRAVVRMESQSVFTDAQGRFILNAPMGSQVNLMLVKPGFSMAEDPGEGFNLSFSMAQLTDPVVLRIYPEAILSGTLSSQEGERLAHVNVMALRASLDESGHHWQPSGQTQTDIDGEFRLTVPTGDYRLQTMYVRSEPLTGKSVLPLVFPIDERTRAKSSIHLAAGEERRVDLTATLAKAYEVVLPLDAQQSFASPVNVIATQDDGSPIQVFAESHPDRNSVQIQLPPGTYFLSANRGTEEGPMYAEASVTVGDQPITGPPLHFAPASTIPVEVSLASGTTSDNEAPPVQQLGAYLTGKNASIYDTRHYPVVSRDRISQFSIAPGSYDLRAGHNGQWYIQSASYGTTNLLLRDFVTTAGPSAVPIRLTVSRNTGRVQGKTTLDGKPCACWVYLIAMAPSATPLTIFKTSSDGALSALNLPPGQYQAIAFPHRQSADLDNPATIASLTGFSKSLTIEPGATATLNLEAVGDSGLVSAEIAR